MAKEIRTDPIMVKADRLAEMLDCSRSTAVKIGEEANAKIVYGKRIFFKISAVDAYLEGLRQ